MAEETKLTGAMSATTKSGLWTRMTHGAPFLRTKKGIAILVLTVLIIVGGGLAGLAALPKNRNDSGNNTGSGGTGGGGTGSGSPNTITSDTYFYGQSPPIYPSPNMTGSGTWGSAMQMAQTMVSNMTLAEKVGITAGATSSTGCVGYIQAIPRLGFPGLCLQDAGQGVRGTDFVSSWPSGIQVGASWNRDLSRQRALGMGGEFRTKGVNVLLGPVVGPMGRTVTSGRIWEGISPDPYLAGALVSETVQGVQSAGVITSTKHYIGNEQETYRQPTSGKESVSSNIDDRTIHELYLWPFQDAVRAGSGNIMCSYQRLNNSYGCSNSYILNGLLKTELGFQGFVVSDWGAQHAGVATAMAGLDMTMPSDGGFWGSNLYQAVSNGSVPEARLDDMATRIIATWYKLGQDKGYPSPGFGMPADLRKPHSIVDARNATFKSTLFDGAVEGHVLVKNVRNALPLQKPRIISVHGYSATGPNQYNIDGGGLSIWSLGAESVGLAAVANGFFGTTNYAYPVFAINGTLLSGGGSGANTPALFQSPMDILRQQAYADDTALFWDFQTAQPNVHGDADACLVLVNAWASEGSDRPALRDDYTDGMIKHVADACNNTIVVFHNAGVRLVDQFIDHENVTAVIFAHLPGQESGRALVSLLYGNSTFSGKLPYTVARNESDYGDLLHPAQAEGIFTNYPQANFTEGVYIDYRHFDAQNITPRYEFGYGLSYTTFDYSELSINKNASTNTFQYPTGPILEGGQADLWDNVVTVSASIRNTGRVDGAEIAQLYITLPSAATNSSDTPIRQLRGFQKTLIQSGQSATTTFGLTRRDLSIWDVKAQRWSMEPGKYTVFVGSSSRILPVNGTFDL